MNGNKQNEKSMLVLCKKCKNRAVEHKNVHVQSTQCYHFGIT